MLLLTTSLRDSGVMPASDLTRVQTGTAFLKAFLSYGDVLNV
jgi:hypothetical protein